MSVAPYTITNADWIQISTAGKYCKCWLDFDGDGEAGSVNIRIAHSPTKPADANLTNARRIFKPDSNENYFLLEPDNELDIFWARAMGLNDTATLLVDELQGKAVKPGQRDVNLQDQTTPSIIYKFNRVTNTTALTNAITALQYSMTVDNPTGVSVGSYIILFNTTTAKFYDGYVTALAGSVLTMDTPFDNDFPAGSIVRIAVTNMNVVGSQAEPLVYGLRGAATATPFGVTFHVTRILFRCLATSACDLSLFGNLTKLVNGLVLRKRNGNYANIFNVKSNADLAGIMFDFNILSATNPAQGQDGFIGRLTFAGQDKMGVAIPLPPAEDVEFVIQDDLSGLTLLEIVAEGHEVDE